MSGIVLLSGYRLTRLAFSSITNYDVIEVKSRHKIVFMETRKFLISIFYLIQVSLVLKTDQVKYY